MINCVRYCELVHQCDSACCPGRQISVSPSPSTFGTRNIARDIMSCYGRGRWVSVCWPDRQFPVNSCPSTFGKRKLCQVLRLIEEVVSVCWPGRRIPPSTFSTRMFSETLAGMSWPRWEASICWLGTSNSGQLKNEILCQVLPGYILIVTNSSGLRLMVKESR
jgi:hypothetical protein